MRRKALLTDVGVAEGVLRVRERARASLQLVHAQAAEHQQQAEQLAEGSHFLFVLVLFASRRFSPLFVSRAVFFFFSSLFLHRSGEVCARVRSC